jgi:iron(III) transport system substrate-binding protein
MNRRWIVAALFVAVAATPGAAAAPEAVATYGPAQPQTTLLVRGTTDIAAFAPVLTAFAAVTPGLGIRYEQWGSNDLYRVAAAACRGEGQASDMVISSAVDQQVRLVNDGCAQPYRSFLTDALPPGQTWRHEIFGVTQEPAVIVYNRDLVAPEEAPQSRFDLIDLLSAPASRFAGRVATYDIEASGLGYLLAFADAQQATTFGRLFEAFGRSGAVATCCSAEIIDAVAEGRFLVAYNVLGSYALERADREPRIAVVAPQDYTLVLSRAALIPKAARNAPQAGAFLDFMLSPAGRQTLAGTHLVVRLGGTEGNDIELPDGAASVLRQIALSPALLVGLDRQKRALFVDRWRAALRKE